VVINQEYRYPNKGISDNRLSINTLIVLLKVARPYARYFVHAIISLLIASGILLFLPGILRTLIDRNGFPEISSLITLGILAIALGCSAAWRSYNIACLGAHIVRDLNNKTFQHILSMPPCVTEQFGVDNILIRMTTDFEKLSSLFGNTLSIFLRNCILAIGGVIMMLITSTQMTLIFILIVCSIAVPSCTIVMLTMHYSGDVRTKHTKILEYITECLQTLMTIQSYNAENSISNNFSCMLNDHLSKNIKFVRMKSILIAVIISSVFTGMVLLGWYGMYNIQNKSMMIGSISQFLMYTAIASLSIAGLTESWNDCIRAMRGLERINNLMSSDIKPKDNIEHNNTNTLSQHATQQCLSHDEQECIRFSDVNFIYGNKEQGKSLFRNLSFLIPKGAKVALVGPSGSGKTTALKLIMRFYETQKGSISIQGTDIRNMDIKELRSLVTFLPQSPCIFSDTIMQNICFGIPNVTYDDIVIAAKQASADSFIMELPKQYDTWTGERGSILSEGQKQKIALARALLRNTPIILLDEPTSSIDSEADAYITGAIHNLPSDKTVIMTAHRLKTVQQADYIFVFDKGQIIEKGNHLSLLESNGMYAHMVALQKFS